MLVKSTHSRHTTPRPVEWWLVGSIPVWLHGSECSFASANSHPEPPAKHRGYFLNLCTLVFGCRAVQPSVRRFQNHILKIQMMVSGWAHRDGTAVFSVTHFSRGREPPARTRKCLPGVYGGAALIHAAWIQRQASWWRTGSQLFPCYDLVMTEPQTQRYRPL